MPARKAWRWSRPACGPEQQGFKLRAPGLGASPVTHWHFISTDRSYGGHVLAIGLVNAVANITPSHKVDLDLPANKDLANSDETKDWTADLHQVEK